MSPLFDPPLGGATQVSPCLLHRLSNFSCWCLSEIWHLLKRGPSYLDSKRGRGRRWERGRIFCWWWKNEHLSLQFLYPASAKMYPSLDTLLTIFCKWERMIERNYWHIQLSYPYGPFTYNSLKWLMCIFWKIQYYSFALSCLNVIHFLSILFK